MSMKEGGDPRRQRIEALVADFGMKPVGQGSAVLDDAWALLDGKGLLDRSGSALMSAEATLVPGPVYFMGLNPGGNQTEGNYPRLFETLNLSRLGCNAFAEDWSTATHTYIPGGSPLQRNFKLVSSLIGLDYADIPASNLVFARSRNLADYDGFDRDVRRCFEVHRLFLATIRPKILWLMGDPARAVSVLDLSRASKLGTMHGGKHIWRGIVSVRDPDQRDYRLFHTPHMRYWWPRNHTDLLSELWAEAND